MTTTGRVLAVLLPLVSLTLTTSVAEAQGPIKIGVELIQAMEGMEFMTPKGKMIFRKEDHQALQSMYAFKLVSRPDSPWLVPQLTRELSPQETAPPILNKR